MNGLWRKSSYSTGNGECVEVADLDHARRGHCMIVRDSKQPAGLVLMTGPGQWSAFVEAISQGEFG